MPIAIIAILDLESPGANLWAAWSFPLLPFIALTVTLFLYHRGWRAAHRTRPRQLPFWRAFSFAGGIAALWIAIASPIDALDDYLLAAHMIQHFILMSIAPPLIVLGAPTVPLLRGLPRFIRVLLRPFFRARRLHRVVRFFLHPVTAWLLMNIAYLGWHVPAAFELTFRSETIHQLEHACFFLDIDRILVGSVLTLAIAPWMANLDRDPLPAQRRHPQHRSFLNSRLFRPRALSVVPARPARLFADTASRPGCRRRRNVGSEFGSVPCSRGRADLPAICAKIVARAVGAMTGGYSGHKKRIPLEPFRSNCRILRLRRPSHGFAP